MTTIECIRGDSKNITINVTENSVAKDLTGYQVHFTVKEQLDTDVTDANALIKKIVSGGAQFDQGIINVTLSSEDTLIDDGSYYYNIRLISSGNSSVISSKNGTFNVILGAGQDNAQ